MKKIILLLSLLAALSCHKSEVTIGCDCTGVPGRVIEEDLAIYDTSGYIRPLSYHLVGLNHYKLCTPNMLKTNIIDKDTVYVSGNVRPSCIKTFTDLPPPERLEIITIRKK